MNLGREGEDLACNYLIDNGYTILQRNWRAGHLEIDIIALNQNGIHFVEVKTRREPVQGKPEDSVNTSKQKKLINAAEKYLSSKKNEILGDMEIYFDVLTIVYDTHNNYHIRYIPEAFIPLFY